MIKVFSRLLRLLLKLIRSKVGYISVDGSIKNIHPYISKESNIEQKIGLIECVTQDDEYINRLLKALNNKNINPKNLKIVGTWNYIGLHGIFHGSSIIDFWNLVVGTNIEKKRWSKIYKAYGIGGFIALDDLNILQKIKVVAEALKIYKQLQGRKNLLDISIEDIPVGDLVYSSYIRFRERPTINYSDKFLLYLLYKLLCINKFLSHSIEIRAIEFYITNYTSYIQHGYIARYLIGKGVKVYSLGNLRSIAKFHLPKDYSHTFRSWEFKGKISNQENTEDLQMLAAKNLERRFSGTNDPAMSYMRVSSYVGQPIDSQKKFDGILFLHDFFDGPSDDGFYLFDDIYTWADHTIGFIQDNELRIAVKPHPNQRPESSKIMAMLKVKYPNVEWLCSGTSNYSIMQEVVGGISIFGSILYELGYFGKVAIAAGDHPGSNFGFSYQPQTISDYDSMLINLKNMSPIESSKEKVIDFYIAHNYLKSIHDVEI